MIGKFVVIDTLNNFNNMQSQIPNSAIVFIKDVGQIYTHGTYFGAQGASTGNILTQTQAGLAPSGGTSTSLQISDVSTEWVLTVTSGKDPSWRKLPANAFNDTKYTASNNGITLSNKTFSLALNSTTKLDSAIGEKIYAVSLDKNGKLCVSVPWEGGGGGSVNNIVSNTENGLAPMIPTSVSSVINTQSSEWVLTSKLGETPTWKKLPSNSFNDTWIAWSGATSSKAGTSGYMPAPTSAQRNQFLRGDGQWVNLNNYSLPTASSDTLGGVKTGAAITDTTDYTAISIKDGVLYYKDTTYTSLKNPNSLTLKYGASGSLTQAWTYDGSSGKTLSLIQGSNISITGDNSGNITIANTYSYTLPTAAKDTLGGVKTSSTVTSTSGYTACPIISGIVYYKNTTYSAQSMTINGNAYNVYTSSSSLPTLYAPTSLGSAGQVLKVNSDGTGLTWGTDEKNANTWRPVKLTSSSGDTNVATDNSTTLKFKAGSNMSLTASGGVITVATKTDTITATTFSGDLSGNASSATKWGSYKISVTSSPGTATDTIYFVT